MDYILIEFWNSCDLGGIFYQKGFKQRLFIESDIVKPKYDIKEEGYNDGDGNFIKTSSREQKIYKMDWIVYEYMLDSIYTIQLHDQIQLTLKNGEIDLIKEVAVEHDFITAGIAKVTMTFKTRYITTTNCCASLGDTSCVHTNLSPVLGLINYKTFDPTSLTYMGRYIIYNGSGRVTNNYIYQAGNGIIGAIENVVKGDVVLNSADSRNYYFDGLIWRLYPVLSTITSPLAGSLRITGWALPYTWLRVGYRVTGGGAWTLHPTTFIVEQLKNGITLTGLTPTVSYDVIVSSYNHNCNYGYSNILAKKVVT